MLTYWKASAFDGENTFMLTSGIGNVIFLYIVFAFFLLVVSFLSFALVSPPPNKTFRSVFTLPLSPFQPVVRPLFLCTWVGCRAVLPLVVLIPALKTGFGLITISDGHLYLPTQGGECLRDVSRKFDLQHSVTSLDGGPPPRYVMEARNHTSKVLEN